MLAAENLRVAAGGITLLDGVSFTVADREKVGLVGRNGAGKTTLLKVLGGSGEPEGGRVRAGGGLGYLPQDPKLDQVPDDLRAVDHILSGQGFDAAATRIEKLRVALEEDPSERNIARFTRAEEQFRIDGGYQADADVRRLAAGLGIDDDRLDLPLATLSGGERRRVELARILFAGSDVLLLDEPTNHLDADAKDWLLDFLRVYRGALVVISHDLDLLDASITRVLHLDRGDHTEMGTMVTYRGTYSEYLDQRAADEARQAKQAAAQQAEIARLQGVVDRFGAKATKASMAHNLEKRIARIEAEGVEAPVARRSMSVRFPEPVRAGRTVLEVTGLTQRYGDLAVYENLSFDLGRGERLLVMGFNGAGKTSLLRVLADAQWPVAGDVRWGLRASPGYYAQEHETLDVSRSLLDGVRRVSSGADESELRQILGTLGLTGDKVHQQAATLSGGEKTKLALAQLIAGGHNVLLLDEPTNNLDPDSRQAVSDALAAWPGTIVFVSHDTEFVRALGADRVLMMPDGSFENWHEELLDLVALA